MGKTARIVTSGALLLWIFCLTPAGAEETLQSRITSINAAEKYIGVTLNGKSVRMHADENTSITKQGKDITFSALGVGNKVKITYVEKSGFMGFGEDYLAQHIKVETMDTAGTGVVMFVEPETKSICIKIHDRRLLLGINEDTEYKGVESLNEFEKQDKVFVDYVIDAQGRKIITLLEKKSG